MAKLSELWGSCSTAEEQTTSVSREGEIPDLFNALASLVLRLHWAKSAGQRSLGTRLLHCMKGTWYVGET